MKSTIIAVGFLGLLAQACGEGSFSGDTKTDKAASEAASQGGGSKAGEPGEPGANAVATKPEPGKVDGGSVSVRVPTESDKKAIGNCEKAWGETAPKYDSVRVIAASVAVLGQSVLKDLRTTTGPELTLIYASVSVLNKLDWELANPNGWYCIVAGVNVLSELTVTIDKNAHLADSAVAVNVLSKGDNVGAASVNVLSNVKVIRK